MVEWLFKKSNLFKSMEDDIFNYEVEMSRKQNEIRNLKRDRELLNKRLEEHQIAANEYLKEKQQEINELMNKLEIKEETRKKLSGKVGSLGRKIKKLEKELEEKEERIEYWRGKSV